MPRRSLGILIFLLVSVLMSRAQGDIVFLKIGDDAVTKAEFEYYFNRSPVDDVQEYLPAFVDYKLKVLYAREIGLDTLSDFLTQREYYQKALETHGEGVKRSGRTREWIRLKHVTKWLKQQVGKAEEQQAKASLDSLYAAWRKDGIVGESTGEFLWLPKHYLLAEWIRELDKLDENELSAPFSSPLGWHIVWWEAKGHIAQPEGAGMRHVSPEMLALRKKEVDEALLVATLARLDASAYTEKELETFFAEHYEKYDWELPHYQGAVFHCKDKKAAKAIKKALKRCDFHSWKEAVKSKLDVSYKMEYGLFRIGKNKYVDKLVFKCGGFEPLADYPYTFVMGKKLKGPESYQDVRDKVVDDYLKVQEKRRNDVLKQKYKVEIKEEVLKTVNNSRNI